MLDSISSYETDELAEDTCKAVETLLGLLDDRKLKAILKLLITSPSISRKVDELVADDEVFNMPWNPESTEDGFNARRCALDTHKLIEDLNEDKRRDLEWSSESDFETSDDSIDEQATDS